MIKRFRTRLLATAVSLTAAAAFLASCAETPVELPEPTSIVVGEAAVSLSVTEAFQLAAQVLDQDGRVMSTGPGSVTWTSSNSAVARVSAAGVVTGIFPGDAVITATFGSATATVNVTVKAPAFTVRPNVVQLIAGLTQALVATVLTDAGLNITGATVVTYTSLDPTVASVSATGAFPTIFANSEGTTKIVARTLNLTDTVSVTVVTTAEQLISTLTIAQDTVAVWTTLPFGDPLLTVQVTARDANGVDRCGTGPALTLRTNAAIVGVGPGAGNCTIALFPAAVGSTFVVASAGTGIDSIFVNVVPSVASVNVVETAVATDQATILANRPYVQYQFLDPRGANICASQPNPTLTVRNPTLASATAFPFPFGSSPPPGPCRIQIGPGTALTSAGSTFLVVSSANARDSVQVNVSSAGLRFQNGAFTTAPPLADSLVVGGQSSFGVTVVDRTGAPQRNAQVTFNATATPGAFGGGSSAGASDGTFSSTTVATDSLGRASVTYTAPSVLVPAFGFTTQGVTITATGLGPLGQVVTTPPTQFRLAKPGPATRLVFVRTGDAAPVRAGSDTTSTFTSISSATFLGQNIGLRSDSVEIRGYDAFRNRVAIAVTPTVDRTEFATVAVGARGATVNAHTPSAFGQVVSASNHAAGTTRLTVRFQDATAALDITSGPTTSAVWTTGGGAVVVGSPYSTIGSAVRTVYNAGLSTLLFPQFTRSRDTIAFVGTGALGNQVYIRAANGTQAATAVVVADAITSPSSFAAAPVFVPQAGTRGAAIFISDSAGGVTQIYKRDAGAATTVTVLVANTSSFVRFTSLALSPDNATLAVTTALVPGNADSTRAANVFRYNASTGALVDQVTTNTDTTLARTVQFNRPAFGPAGQLVFERHDAISFQNVLFVLEGAVLRPLITSVSFGPVPHHASFDPAGTTRFGYTAFGFLWVYTSDGANALPGAVPPSTFARGVTAWAWSHK